MDFVCEGICASDENVINIDINKIKTTSDFVHKTSKGLSCIAKTKGHLGEFKQSKWGGNSGFADVTVSHRDLMVSADKVDFREDGFTMEGGGEILNMGNRVLVRYGYMIEDRIIITWAPVAMLRLADHVKWRSPGTT